jgi:integrase
VSAREKAIRAHRELLSGGDKISYFEERGISAETIRAAWVGYDAASGAFTYPCIARGGGLLGIHYKSEGRDENGKRRQWWGGYAEDLPAKGHDGLVFPSTVGTPLSHRNVVRSFKALLKRADLPAGIRLYDLRHTCATLLLNSNVHPKYVQELLGHASIAQTLDTYSHVLKGMDGGIGDAMDAAVG